MSIMSDIINSDNQNIITEYTINEDELAPSWDELAFHIGDVYVNVYHWSSEPNSPFRVEYTDVEYPEVGEWYWKFLDYISVDDMPRDIYSLMDIVKEMLVKKKMLTVA